MKKTYEIKENNLTNIKIETDDKMKELEESRKIYFKIIAGLMLSCFGVDVLTPIIIGITDTIRLTIILIIVLGYTTFMTILTTIIWLLFTPQDSVERIYDIQQKLENSEQFPSIIFTKLKEDEIENWDKDYILLKTEVDEKNRTANIKVYVPYNSLLFL